MNYVVPNWEREFLSQPWHVQKWCLIKAEGDLKKAKKQHKITKFMLFWCLAWFVYQIVNWNGWWSIGLICFYSLFLFLYWHMWKAEKRKVEVVTAVHERMKELISTDP